MWQARHGDILLEQMGGIPKGSRLLEIGNHIVVAVGEQTGHSHVMEAGAPIIERWELPDGGIAIRNARTITHQEHGVLVIPPLVRVIPQKEANWHLERQWSTVSD